MMKKYLKNVSNDGGDININKKTNEIVVDV